MSGPTGLVDLLKEAFSHLNKLLDSPICLPDGTGTTGTTGILVLDCDADAADDSFANKEIIIKGKANLYKARSQSKALSKPGCDRCARSARNSRKRVSVDGSTPFDLIKS